MRGCERSALLIFTKFNIIIAVDITKTLHHGIGQVVYSIVYEYEYLTKNYLYYNNIIAIICIMNE